MRLTYLLRTTAWAGTACVALSALGASGSYAAPVVIDNFETQSATQPLEQSIFATGFASEETPEATSGDIIGGFRDTYVDIDIPDGGSGAQTLAAFSDGGGTFDIAAPPGAYEGSVQLTWDGSDGAPTTQGAGGVNTAGLGGVDLENDTGGGPNDRFSLFVDFADANVDFGLTVWDSDSSDTVNGTIPTGAPVATTDSTVPVLYSSFSGIDFTDIGAIQLTFDPIENGADLNIGLIAGTQQIPVPATFGLLGAGLIGLGVATRRRRRA
jgi:hypothetical protein